MSRAGAPRRVALLAGLSPSLSAAVLAMESGFDEVIRVERFTPGVPTRPVDDVTVADLLVVGCADREAPALDPRPMLLRSAVSALDDRRGRAIALNDGPNRAQRRGRWPA